MSLDDLRARAREVWSEFRSRKPRVLLGAATCGRACGILDIDAAVRDGLAALGIDALIKHVGCLGLCCAEPLVEVTGEDGVRVLYGGLQPDEAVSVVEAHLRRGEIDREKAVAVVEGECDGVPPLSAHPMMKGQVRVVLRNAGVIDPEDILHYVARGGYEGLEKSLGMKPDEVVEAVKRSGLRGRGGAGFPTGLKWGFCRRAPGDDKYVVCNADEGDPGAFMDRSVLESDPHSVLEGLLIAAYAIGAAHGYVYARAEYPLAIERLERAIEQAREAGILGGNVLASGFSFDLRVKKGAGAFVCGEETALMASIEGKRGMPRPRPPYPAQSGLFGKPTNINNVETLANVPEILRRGADWFASLGTENSPGTKTFALAGKINRTGLIEVPMGIRLREIIFDMGGGVPRGKKFKAVQTGGPSGGCIPAHLLGIEVDYDNLAREGSIMGSGGMVVMDEETCIVDVARYFLDFTAAESCGKCPPCRLGTRQMLTILTDICSGRATEADIGLLEEIGRSVKASSLCGLGQTAPNPVLTTLKHFRDEYVEHIRLGKCRAAVCKALVRAPCTHSCPAGVDVPRYVRFIAAGRPREAYLTIRERLPFPSVCGRVCFHPCEARCRRGLIEEPIAVRALKRYATEAGAGEVDLPTPVPTGKNVAVVGAGPAGLTCAYYLARKGHDVTVFEKEDVPGGTMRLGIPAFRLPREVLNEEIAAIERAGVKIELGKEVSSAAELLEKGFHAAFFAVGAQQGLALRVEGEELDGVYEAMEFLRARPTLQGDAVVVGGGSSAMDAARVALRLGAEKVTLVYRRTRAEMPAADEEIEEAREEGVTFVFLASPVSVSKANGALAARFEKMRLGEFDRSGRRRPEPAGEFFEVRCSTLIAAIGQRPEADSLGVELGRRGTVNVDPYTLCTSAVNVWAGGDAVTGPASIIEAIAAGRKAAEEIDRRLGGDGDISESLAPEAPPPEGEMAEEVIPRVRPGAADPEGRRRSWDEVERVYSADEARREAERCLRCDLEE